MSIMRLGLWLFTTLALGCAGTITRRPQAELERKDHECGLHGTWVLNDPECLAVTEEIHRRRAIALTAYLGRWTTHGERTDPAICRAASEDLRLLESLHDASSAKVAGVCAQGTTRYGWERCERDAQVGADTALVEHGAALLRCGYVDALRPFFASLDAAEPMLASLDANGRFLSVGVAEAITRRTGTRRMLQYLDEADQEPWQLARAAEADPVDCDTITALRDRGLQGVRALLGARQGCAAIVRAVTDGLGDADPGVRSRACELAYEVPKSALTSRLTDERTRVEQKDPFSTVRTTHYAGRSIPFPSSGSAIGDVAILPIWLVLDGLTRAASSSTTSSTSYPVREACFRSSIRRR